MPPLQGQWLEALKPEFKKPYYKELFTKVGEEYQRRKIFPAPDDIFNAFHLTPLDQVKVVEETKVVKVVASKVVMVAEKRIRRQEKVLVLNLSPRYQMVMFLQLKLRHCSVMHLEV